MNIKIQMTTMPMSINSDHTFLRIAESSHPSCLGQRTEPRDPSYLGLRVQYQECMLDSDSELDMAVLTIQHVPNDRSEVRFLIDVTDTHCIGVGSRNFAQSRTNPSMLIPQNNIPVCRTHGNRTDV